MQADDRLQIERDGIEIPEPTLVGLRQTAKFTFDNFPWQQMADKWLAYVENYTDALRDFRGGGHGN